MAPAWSRLPWDVCAFILCHLPVADYIRSGAVCTNWRRATVGKNHRRNPKSPWLMFPSTANEDSGDPDSFTFFSICDGTHRRFNLPQIRGKWCVGSSDGSVVVTDNTEILLIDPITAAVVRFPPAPVVDDLDGEYPLIQKVVFSPSASVAVVIYLIVQGSEIRYSSYARVGNNLWSVIRESIFGGFCDVIIHKGVFYMLSLEGFILMFDPDKRRTYPRCNAYVPDWNHQPFGKYLVESVDGDQLLIVRRVRNESGMTVSFVIFKQDKVGLQWVEMGSLGEIAIFIGRNYSTCIFTRGLPELRGNCVYFTEDRILQQNRDDFGVFSLEVGGIEHHVCLQHIRRSLPMPFWIMPSSP